MKKNSTNGKFYTDVHPAIFLFNNAWTITFLNKFNFWLLLITYSDKCKFLCMCPLLMRLIRNYFFRIFWKFINHFLKSEATRIYVNGTTRNLVKNSTYFWPQREPYSHLIWIDDFSIHVFCGLSDFSSLPSNHISKWNPSPSKLIANTCSISNGMYSLGLRHLYVRAYMHWTVVKCMTVFHWIF